MPTPDTSSARRSWVESARDDRTDFPIQNLPFGVFRRQPDERYPTLDALLDHCRREKSESIDRWHAPHALGFA